MTLPLRKLATTVAPQLGIDPLSTTGGSSPSGRSDERARKDRVAIEGLPPREASGR